MSTKSRREYFAILRARYRHATSKAERSFIVYEAVLNTGLHRKSVIRALNERRNIDGELLKLGRPRKYSKGCSDLLKRFYRASDFVCSDKLKAMIPTLRKQWRGPIDVDHLEELQKISASSIDRYLKKYRGLERVRSNTRTRPGSRLFKKMIPLKALGNIAPRPGFLQADTVSHGGGREEGHHAWSLTMTDEKVGWTENGAFMGKSANRTQPAIKKIHDNLPFELFAINVDNGSEFLNSRVVEYFTYVAEENVIPFPMTRSRPYRKNDNCHVEQKNWTTVRQLFGYDRIDDEELIPLMNEIYRVQNLISNFFVPQFKLKSKTRVMGKIKKKYDDPKTPYQRLLEEPSVPEANKQKLREQYATLNYFDLVLERERLLAHFEKTKKELKLKKQVNSPDPLPDASR